MAYRITTHNKRFWKTIVFFVISLFLFLCVVLYFNTMPVVVNVSKAILNAEVLKLINETVYLSPIEASYEDFVEIIKDENGNVALLRVNTSLVNSVTMLIATKLTERVEILKQKSIPIALGTLVDRPFWNGKGPEIPLTVLSQSGVYVDVRSEFNQAGINQTQHKILLSVNVNLNAVIGTKNFNDDFCVDVLLCESLIVGKIPEVFLSDFPK